MDRVSKFFNKDKVQIVAIILIILIISGILVFSYRHDIEKEINEDKSQIDKLIEYKDTYVGDASKVGSIVRLLDYSEYINRGIELKTSNEPYSLTINYSDFKPDYADLLKNAQAIFILVTNVDMVIFNVGVSDDVQNTFIDKQYAFKRDFVEKIYNRDLKEYSTNVSLWKEDVTVARDYVNNLTKAEAMYLEVITDIIGYDVALDDNIKYIAIDINSFSNTTDDEKEFLLEYVSNYNNDIKNIDYDEVINKSYIEDLKRLEGMFIDIVGINKTNEDTYTITARRYIGSFQSNTYSLTYENNKWSLLHTASAMS